MKIRTNLFLLAIVFVVSIVAVGLVMFHTFIRTNVLVELNSRASEAIKDVCELNIITHEYVLHYEKRMEQQWGLKYDSLGESLRSLERGCLGTKECCPVKEAMNRNYQALGDLFFQLRENAAKRKRLGEENGPQSRTDLTLASGEMLATQILMRSQRMATDAFTLRGMIAEEIVRAQRRASRVVLFSTIGFVVLSSSIAFFTCRGITGPVDRLVQGARIIGKGNLKHRARLEIKNEIGELARAFDEMTERRQGVEEELKKHQEHLEELVEGRTGELRDAQEQLVRKEKLAVMGKLAGGMAHELRNPLGAIKNAVYFLNMALEEPEADVKETLEVLAREVGTSERIIATLLDFARPKPPVRQKVDINEIVQAALSRITIPKSVQVERRLDDSLPTVLADPDQLRMAFGNIILNGIQAMPEGGQLGVKTGGKGGNGVMVCFSDTGTGISGEDLGRIFEPLFTNKAKGVGLGLAVSKTLVEGQGGRLRVESEVGKGSTFTVRLAVHLDGQE